MNERGVSLLETVLGMAILSVMALTLIPTVQHLQHKLYAKQLAVHASEVALNGARMVEAAYQTSGTMAIQGTDFHWLYDGQTICVTYAGLDGTVHTCIDM